MNELLAQAYNTEANVAANTEGVEKTAEAVLFEELEKIAAAEGIDLNEFSDNDILEIIGEAMGETEKTAAAETVDGEGQEKLAEADFLGRTMAHAFYDELTSIQNGGTTKTAADAEVEEAFEEAAVARAQEILNYIEGTDTLKTSSVFENDEDLDSAITERAAAYLADAGYDVNEIANHLLND